MPSHNGKCLTKAEFYGWASEIQTSFNSVEAKLDRHEVILSEHSHHLVAIEERLAEHSQRLATIEKTLSAHTTILSEIASTLKTIREELHAHVRLYDRLDHRDHVFADKLGLDLSKVDSEA